MANFNRVVLVGNLTRDPELSYTPSNMAVCKFGIAVNHKSTNRQTNVTREEVMFIDCTAWGKTGETINQYCRKGRPLLVEGRLVFDQWTSQEGQKRSKHYVNVDNFQFLGSVPGGAGTGGGAPSVGERRSESDYAPADSGTMDSGGGGQSSGNDDVPF